MTSLYGVTGEKNLPKKVYGDQVTSTVTTKKSAKLSMKVAKNYIKSAKKVTNNLF